MWPWPRAGARTLTATYAGDANFAGSVSAGAGHTVNMATSTTAITSNLPNPSVTGQGVVVNFSVTSTGGTPTGTVTVSDGAVSCFASVATGTCTLTPSSAGAKTLTATYAGDANFSGSVSSGVSQTVNLAATTAAITSHLPDPSTVGQLVAVNFTVTATAPGSGTPTGNVTVSDGVNSCIGAVASGTCSVALATPGARTLTATYAGDANFAGSVSAGAGHTVGMATSTTTITSNLPNPSVTGQGVVVNFTVTSTGGTPTGTVTVSDGTDSCFASVATGTCTLTPSSAGAKTLTATYAGDANFSGSVSSGVSQTVNLAATTTAITSHLPDPSVVGQAYTVSFTVTATAPGSGTPTGNVTVSDGVATCIGTVAAGSCSITSTTVGAPKTLTATYAGDANYTGSVSAGASHTVNQAATTTTIASDLPDPSVVGQGITVNFTTVAAAPGSGTPTGTVTVSDGTDSCLGSVASGTCTLTPTTSGAKTLTATYGADANFAGSTSAGTAHQVDPFGAVDPGNSMLTVSSGTITASSGASATTITVTAKDVFGNLITGATVVLSVTGSGNSITQPGATNGSGQATGTLSATVAESKTVSAMIDGTGVTQTQIVTVNPDVLNPATSTATVPGGTAGSLTTITIQARDQFGNAVTSGGSAVTVVVTGTNAGASVTIQDNGDGTYTATYTPAAMGSDTIDIQINGTGISGNTFTSTVT